MAAPATSTKGPTRFTAPDGVVYRVLDCLMRDGKLIAADPPASWAKTRVFRPADGWRRLYRFAPGEDRTPSAAALAHQFAAAEFLPVEPAAPQALDPR